MRRLLPAILLAGCASWRQDEAVVQVQGESLGSGVAVAPDRVMTAAHLLDARDPVVLRWFNATRGVQSPAHVVSVSGDLAILSVPGPLHFISISCTHIQPGDALTILDGTVWPAAHIKAHAVGSDAARPTSRLDRVGPGLSGAPVLLDGRLVGLVSGILSGATDRPLVVFSPIRKGDLP